MKQSCEHLHHDNKKLLLDCKHPASDMTVTALILFLFLPFLHLTSNAKRFRAQLMIIFITDQNLISPQLLHQQLSSQNWHTHLG